MFIVLGSMLSYAVSSMLRDISGLSALNRALDKNCTDMGGINVDTSTFFLKKTTCYIGKSNGLLSVEK